LQEATEFRGINFRVVPDPDGDFLPPTSQVACFDSRFTSVDGNFLHFIEWGQSEFGIERFRVELVTSDSEAQCQQPFGGGASVKKPARAFGCPNFNGRTIIPVGWCECSVLFQQIDDQLQCASFPVAGLSVMCDAVLCMPFSPIGFPGQFCGASQLFNADITGAFFRYGCRIKCGDLFCARLGQYRCQQFAGP
jgi:hypothetical protein